MSINKFPNKQDIIDAYFRINKYIHHTPIMTSELVNKHAQCEIFFKCENFQKMGAFKMRGATNAILQLNFEEQAKGVATHSSGNFAQALALAAKTFNIPAHIVMPSNAPQIKKDAVKGYGGIIYECEPTQNAREAKLNKIVEKTGASFIHPYNDINVILGQATAAYELIKDSNELDFLIAPVGGGGLISGTALSAKYFTKSTFVYGGEPSGADDAWQSLQKGKIIPSINPQTIADGLRTSLGDKTFPIIQELVKDIILVEESEIIESMRFIWERMKIIIEPSSAVAFAVVLKNKNIFKGKKVGIIISGGNVDLSNLPF